MFIKTNAFRWILNYSFLDKKLPNQPQIDVNKILSKETVNHFFHHVTKDIQGITLKVRIKQINVLYYSSGRMEELLTTLSKEEHDQLLIEGIRRQTFPLDVCRMFIKFGANPNAFLGAYSLLAHACRQSKFEEAKLLLECGADLNIKSKEGGTTPIFQAIYPGVSLEIVTELFKYEANLNIENNHRLTPLFYAIATLLKNPEKGDSMLQIIKLLLDSGADPNQASVNQTPLAMAVRNLDDAKNSHERSLVWKVLNLLLEKGADPNQISGNQTPFCEAVDNLNSDKNCDEREFEWKVLNLLLEKGANPNIPTKKGFYPISWVNYMNVDKQMDFILLLIKFGADPSLINSDNSSVVTNLLNHFPPNLNAIDFLLKNYNFNFNLPLIHESKPSLTPAFLLSLNHVYSKEGLKAYDHETELRLLTSNIFGLENHFFTLGCRPFLFAYKWMNQLLEQILTFFKNNPEKSIIESYIRVINDQTLSDLEIIEKYQNGENIILQTGWNDHAISILIFKNYLIICNRGPTLEEDHVGIRVWKIDRTLPLTGDIIDSMKYKYKQEKDGLEYFYITLPALFGASPLEDPISKVINTSCKMKGQEVGNCWWVSLKASFYAYATFYKIEEFQKKYNREPTDKELKILIKESRRLYKYFSEFTRLDVFRRYLQGTFEGIRKDYGLIEECIGKIFQKKWRYFKLNNNSPVKKSSHYADSLPLFPYNSQDVYEWLENDYLETKEGKCLLHYQKKNDQNQFIPRFCSG